MRAVLFLILIVFSFSLAGCTCSPLTTSRLDVAPANSSRMMKDLEFFTAGPHPFGSEYQDQVANYLSNQLQAAGLDVTRQRFSSVVPNRRLKKPYNENDGMAPLSVTTAGTNIIAQLKHRTAKSCVVLLGSHYDTKFIEGLSYVGANDSGSSSVVLLELMRQLASQPLDTECSVAAVWFDGEEAVLDSWYAGEQEHPARIHDNTYGSRYFVSQMSPCESGFCLPANLGSARVVAHILLDMVGSKNLKFSNEGHSHPRLRDLKSKVLKELNWGDLEAPEEKLIEDDHLPFVQKGIPSLNLIDFENVYTWHNSGDVISDIDPKSLVKSGTLALKLALLIAANPKDLQD